MTKTVNDLNVIENKTNTVRENDVISRVVINGSVVTIEPVLEKVVFISVTEITLDIVLGIHCKLSVKQLWTDLFGVTY